MFMAAAPEGQSDLDYEAEEAAILEATRAKDGRAPLAHVLVEETGALDFLAARMRLDGPFEALHLSCHGDILAQDGEAPRPILLLETPEGGSDAVAPERLIEELANGVPPLVFVSACRTAERGAGRKGIATIAGGYKQDGLAEARATFDNAAKPRDADGTAIEAPPELAEPFVRQLAVHAPNVLGWDGSVYDRDAMTFAEALYGELAHGETVPRAAARARRKLFAAKARDPLLGRHWHLARVYLGPGGGGALCDPARESRPARPEAEQAFLDLRNKRCAGRDPRRIRRPPPADTENARRLPRRPPGRADPRQGQSRQVEPRGAGRGAHATPPHGGRVRQVPRACRLRRAQGRDRGHRPGCPTRRRNLCSTRLRRSRRRSPTTIAPSAVRSDGCSGARSTRTRCC
jgi:hypothetical protein